MEDVKNDINNLKQKIKDVVKEIKLEMENSKDKVESIKEVIPQTLVARLKNEGAYCNSSVEALAIGDGFKHIELESSSNYANFYAIATGNHAWASGGAVTNCSCSGYTPWEGQGSKEGEIKHLSKFNEELNDREELKELKETLKKKCETIKGYVDEIIRLSKEAEVKNIDGDNIKVIKSNGVTLVCIGNALAGSQGNTSSATYSGIVNNDDIATAYGNSGALGDTVAIAYGHSELDCQCKDCK